jgi:hypothetical protein
MICEASLFLENKFEMKKAWKAGTLSATIQPTVTMDCSICFDAITKSTGSVSLSCEHTFHFRCIDEWFTKQILEEQDQTCPCCRSKGTDLDRCNAEVVQENEEDDDDESYVDDDEEENGDEDDSLHDLAQQVESGVLRFERLASGEWVITNNHELALEGVRALFGPLNDLEGQGEDQGQEQAARKIQAFFRGNQYRNNHMAAMALMRLFQQAYNL